MPTEMKQHTKILLSLLALLLSLTANSVLAIENEAIYVTAQKAYQEKDYVKALESYKSILNNNVEAAELYYNIANCYYKIDSIGRAIQYYEKARKIVGDDDDIMFNLKIAHAKTVDKIEPMSEFIMSSTWKSIVNSKTIDSWANYSLLNFSLIFVALILFSITRLPALKKLFFGIAVLLLLLSILFYFLAKSRSLADSTINQGVVIQNSLPIKSAPQENATDLFVIHEGTIFKILEDQTLWLKIRLDNGNVGWVKKQAIGEI